MSLLSNCKVCTRDESIWSSFFPNNFKSSIKRRWLTLNPSQDYNLLLIFSIPVFSNGSKHTKNNMGKMPLLMRVTSKLSPDDDNSTFHVCILSIRIFFHILSYPKHLQTLDDPAVWYHARCFPVITPSHRQICVPFLAILQNSFVN